MSASPALLPRERHWLVMGSNSSLSLGQMHRKLPSKFSHRASPHSAKLISHSFTSEKDRRGKEGKGVRIRHIHTGMRSVRSWQGHCIISLREVIISKKRHSWIDNGCLRVCANYRIKYNCSINHFLLIGNTCGFWSKSPLSTSNMEKVD